MELPENYTDPFTIVFQGFWEVLDCNPIFSQFVRPKNRVKLDSVLGTKDSVQHGDLPEIVILPTGISQVDLGTSGTARVSETFHILISTDDKRPQFVHALEWELFRCIETFNALKAGTLKYNGLRFVEIMKMGSGSQAVTIPETNRGINGWCASWDCTVDMFFPNNEVIFNLEKD